MKIALFFTRSTSLKTWVERGLFDREKLIYERHLNDGTLEAVHWLTYGSDDEALAHRLKLDGFLDPRICVHGRPKWFPSGWFGEAIYSIFMPLIHATVLSTVDVLKTNQLDGGWSAVVARSLFHKPLLLRCGYVQSKLETSLRRLPTWRLRLMLALECFQYRHANLAMVTSEHNARYLVDSHGIPKEKIRVIPNYVDEVLFAPVPDRSAANCLARVLYVGRLSREKNLDALVRAVAMAKLPLDLVGSGPQKEHLEVLASKLGVDIKFLGTVPNNGLPALLNQYRYFALTSYFEGMPKSLLEAMACGLVCVGTDVEGVNEVIHDGVDGFLAQGVDAEAIWEALSRARAADETTVGAAARRNILTRHTISVVARGEADLYLELIR